MSAPPQECCLSRIRMRWSAVTAVALVAALCGVFLFARPLRRNHVISPARARVPVPDFTDSFGDGTPDFLRLDNDADRQAFRRWFTFLAEAQYFRSAPSEEVGDCAALLRFAYREALRRHDGSWAAGMALPTPPPIPAIRQYDYPHTLLGANIFRIRDGQFAEVNLHDGSFGEFADASSLRRFNSHFLSRDLGVALPGDLFFFRQFNQTSPYHAMIYLGRSQLQPGTETYVVYHTGPIGNHPGEIRRPSLRELMAHPETRWRPVRDNPAFLGVYRWNILRGAN